jgi:hypothetical protein
MTWVNMSNIAVIQTVKGLNIIKRKNKVLISYSYLQSIGAKQRIMELMTHQDADVRYQALCATQKYFAMTT